MNKPKFETPDMVEKNIEKLAEIFPNCITEARDENGKLKKAVNFEMLQQILSTEFPPEGSPERYEFTWVGKRAAIAEANKPIRKTLRPCKAESKNWDTTENLYIEGDNLEVLKLLQESYLGKVKMIYIDPPYNTGNDFIYRDDFKQTQQEYEEQAGLFDEEENRLFKNTETNGRFHSDWCSMMYKTFMISKNLLSNDGVIFISIGVEELVNLKKICDEVFGEKNFIEIFSWVKTSTPPSLDAKSRKTNEYILCYEKKKNEIKYNAELLDGGDQPLLNTGNSIKILNFPKDKVEFAKQAFVDGIYEPYQTDRVRLLDRIEIINGKSLNDFRLEGEFKWSQEFLNDEINKGTTFIIKSKLLSIRFIRVEEGFKRPTNFIKDKYLTPLINKEKNNVETNEKASAELKNLMDGIEIFSHPKPVSLIKYLINFICKDNDIVLDYFSGSGTTAEAVFNYNLENRKNLKFILIQIAEDIDKTLKLMNAGEKNIALKSINFLDKYRKPHFITEIGKERIRRAGEKIKVDNPLTTQDLDIGFRVFKVDSSNMNDVYYSAGEYSQDMLVNLEDNIKSDRTDLDLLFGCLLDWGLPISLSYTSEQIENYTVHTYNEGDLIACFDENIPESVIKEIAKRKPLRAVFRDAGFGSSPEKINVTEIFKMLAPDTDVKVI